MKADALTPRDLFDGKVHYEIPAFQRPYVWSEEDQWAPLWTDVRRVAESLIALGKSDEKHAGRIGHFLGAVVLKATPPIAGDVTRYFVIDGQQRMTTMQLLLDAAQEVIEKLGYSNEAEALGDLILNTGTRFEGKPERFKLWPSRADRAGFEFAMNPPEGCCPTDSRVVEAHRYFQSEIQKWVLGEGQEPDEQVPGDQRSRAFCLAEVLQSKLSLVSINLEVADDDQLIFETLNDRGTPLLAADLIKNWVFQRGSELHADVETWADRYWLEFDDEWWRQEISQGRHMRSRIDVFLQYWLTMRTREEVSSDGIFRRFRQYAAAHTKNLEQVEYLLVQLTKDAATFRGFSRLSPDVPAGGFYSRVIEALELAATAPLLLWMLSDNHAVPPAEVEKGLCALESWVIRRTLLRHTMKDVNKLMVSLLGELDTGAVEVAGQVVYDFLAAQTADARMWPTDSDIINELPNIRLYGNVRQGRLRVVLEGIEKRLRTDRHENTFLPQKLEIEHVMPQAWRTYWNEERQLRTDEATARDKLVNTLGNLTLVNQKLNGALSNRPWSNEAASIVAPNGSEAGVGKRSLLGRYSLLVMNKELIDNHTESWTESDIRARGERMARKLCEVWPR